MPGVAIAHNLKRKRIRIDYLGNEVDPQSGEVLVPTETPYVPTKAEMKAAQEKEVIPPEKLKESLEEIRLGKVIDVPVKSTGNMESKIEAMISAKIEALIEKKVNDVLEKLLK